MDGMHLLLASIVVHEPVGPRESSLVGVSRPEQRCSQVTHSLLQKKQKGTQHLSIKVPFSLLYIISSLF